MYIYGLLINNNRFYIHGSIHWIMWSPIIRAFTGPAQQAKCQPSSEGPLLHRKRRKFIQSQRISSDSSRTSHLDCIVFAAMLHPTLMKHCTFSSLTVFLIYQELITFMITRPTTVSSEEKTLDQDTFPQILVCLDPGLNSTARGGLHSVVSHKSFFGNQEIRQLELWNFSKWEVLLVVSGKVLWRMCIQGLGAKINQQINLTLMWNH